MPEVGVVVLASGSSERFKEGNKLLFPFHGKPMLAYTLEALPSSLFGKRLVVTRSEAIAALAREYGFQTLLHTLPEVSDTIRLGTEAMADMAGCLYCVGDQPLLRVQSVQRIVEAFLAQPDRIVRAAYGAREGNPVLFPSLLFPAMRSLSPGQSGGAVIKAHRELVETVQIALEAELDDVDTISDLEKALHTEMR